MIISTWENQIPLALENGVESSKSFPLELNLDSIDGNPTASRSPESPLVDTFTDVNVVPEHEKNQLEQTISNLEGKIIQKLMFLFG